MTDEEYKERFQKLEIERMEREGELKNILFDKLKEMSEIKFEDCANNEYPEICKAMNEIAKTVFRMI